MVRLLFVGQTQLIDSVVIPVVFDSGSIFQVKSDAITAAVQSANAYTDGSILTVNNRIADVSLTANGLVSTVQSHTTSINTLDGSVNTLNSSVSQIAQTADSISTRVTAIENESYVSESTLLQTANQIKAQINTSLGATGIDITNQLITISAANTSINGNLNLYDSYNNGLTIYDENSIPRVNLQSDAIDSIADLATDTYTHYTLSGSGSVTNRSDMTTNQQSITLAQYETLDLDKFNVYLYASNGSTNSYPTSYTGHVVIRIQYPDNSIHTYDKLVFKRDNYGNYGIDAGYRFSAPTSGTYKISFNGWTGGEFTGTQTVYLSVNCRWQTAANAQTYIGRDGFYSHAGANKLIWSGESELQLRYGFNGIRWKDVENKFNSAMEVAANVKGTSPNNKVVWLPFYNYIPTFSVGTGTAPYLFTSQSVGNINETKYAFRIDAYRDRGVCLVKSGYLDSNFNEQESWVILPPTTFTDSDGETASLPVGYTVTIINWTRTNIYVVPYSASYHGVTIEDANRNQNYFCELNGTQSRDTYIYVGNYAGAAQWLSMHDTQ